MHSEKVSRIQRLVDRDGRYRREAFIFTLKALTYTQEKLSRLGQTGHITGRELCIGIRELAEAEFGFLAKTVFEQWGVRSTADFGEIVFLLIEEDQLSKQETDTKDDFLNVYAFDDVFEKVLLPD